MSCNAFKKPAKRTVSTCTATTARGDQCTRRTAKTGPKCWQHTAIEEGVLVKRSNIPRAGCGLFAAKDLRRGTTIPYGGELITAQENDRRARANARYTGDADLNPYAITLNIRGRKNILDSVKTNSGNARYANDARGSRFRNNAEIEQRGRKAVLRLKRPVQEGQEILTSYGAEYWNANNAKRAKRVKR